MTGKELYELFKKHLDARNFKYEPHDDEMHIVLTVHGDDLPQPTVIRVMDDRSVVQIISPIPCKMPEDKRVDGAIAVSVANYGMINGCFDYDFSDGEIRFRVAAGFRGAEFTDETIFYLLAIAFQTTDKYNDKFFMLAKGLLSLEQFIESENG